MRASILAFFGSAYCQLDFDNINYDIKPADLIASGFVEYYSKSANEASDLVQMKNYGTKKTLFVGCGKISETNLKLGAFTTPDDFFGHQKAYTPSVDTNSRANRGYYSYYQSEESGAAIGFSGIQTIRLGSWDIKFSEHDSTAKAAFDNSKLSLFTNSYGFYRCGNEFRGSNFNTFHDDYKFVMYYADDLKTGTWTPPPPLDYDNIGYDIKKADLEAAGFTEYFTIPGNHGTDKRPNQLTEMKNYGSSKTLFIACGLTSTPDVFKLGAFSTPEKLFDLKAYTHFANTDATPNRNYFSYYSSTNPSSNVIGFSGTKTVQLRNLDNYMDESPESRLSAWTSGGISLWRCGTETLVHSKGYTMVMYRHPDLKTGSPQDIVLAKQNCPSTDCWTWNGVTSKCELKESDDKCKYSVTCDAKEMLINFGKNLFGEHHAKAAFKDGATDTDETCLLDTADGDAAPKVYPGFQYKGALGACGQTVSQVTVKDDSNNDVSKIAFTKQLKVLRPTGVPPGTLLDGMTIFTSGAGGVDITFKCTYDISATASSTEIDISTPVDVTAAVTENTGKFDAGLKLKFYTDNKYETELTGPQSIGGTMYAMVEWEVTTLTTKVGFFIEECSVVDVSNPAKDTDKGIKIVKNSCYAGVVDARYSEDRFQTLKAKITYTSFSYDTAANDKQKLVCKINFCFGVTDKTCGSTIKAANTDCTAVTGYDYRALNP